MQPANTKLEDYFRSELTALRGDAVQFGNQYPALADTLGLNARGSNDPQVELLMQSFAFLTGRLKFQVDMDKAEPPNALLAFLYPHLVAPTPCMMIAQIGVKPGEADFSKEQILARGRMIGASADNNMGLKIECRFRTSYETPLMPLHVTDIDLDAITEYAFHGEAIKKRIAAQSVLRVRVQVDAGSKLQSKGLGPTRLRFYINNAEPKAIQLYEILALHLSAITVQLHGNKSESKKDPLFLSDASLRWLGMEADEAMLQANPHTQPGYRLLQEYFAFPEKFMFFEVNNLNQFDFSDAGNYFDLLFLLDMPFDSKVSINPATLLLNCVPLINLYSQRIDPLKVNHTEYEYQLKGDLLNHRYCEIYEIEELESVTSKGSPRPIVPYFGMDDYRRMEQQDYFYVLRRTPSQSTKIAGSEIFVSFLDQRYDLTHLEDEVVGGRALCTNRRLPEQLRSGSQMYLEGAGPVTTITLLNKPTPHHTPSLIGHRPWALISQLSLNHLSIANSPRALSALKDILRLHLGSDPRLAKRQIDAIVSLENQKITRHISEDGWRGFVRGSAITLTMDQSEFNNVNASAVLFCSVLRNFFRMYCSVNSLVELNLDTHHIKGAQKQWLPQHGCKVSI